MSMNLSKVAIVGVGYSQTGRKLALTDDELVHQAVTAAMADAGMTPGDIEGIGTMGGNAMSIGQLLGIMPLNYFFSSGGGPAFVEPAIASISAVASGLCHTCVAVRLIRQQPGQADFLTGNTPRPQGVRGDEQFERAIRKRRRRRHHCRLGDATAHGRVRDHRGAVRPQCGHPASPRHIE